MPFFSKTSKERLATCHPDLQKVANRAIQLIDFTVVCGHRRQAEQDAAFYNGKSTKKWPFSTHNRIPSLAMDLAPYPIDWEDTDRFIYLAGIIIGIGFEYGIPIRWGGDWDSDFITQDEKFRDYPHFELNY